MQMVPAALQYGPAAYRASKFLGQAIRRRLFKAAGERALQGATYAKTAYDTYRALGQFTPRKRSNSYPQVAPRKKVARQLVPYGSTVTRKEKRAMKYKNARYGKLNGTFGGKFAKISRAERNLNAEFIQKGMTTTTETHGLVDDPNCCYIMHSSMAYKPIIKLLAYSLARKLMTLANYDPTTLVETIPYNGLVADSLILKILDQSKTEIASYTPTGTGDCTVAAFGGAIATQLFLYSRQQASPNDKVVPTWLILYQTATDSGGSGNNVILLSKICLLDEVLHLKVSSDMKIQNRSNSASGSANIDDVSNNPLVGRAYTFNYLPRPYNSALDVFQNIDSDYGVKLFRAAEFQITTGGSYMKEPPIPKTFRNCKGSALVRLEPGQIKHYYLQEVVIKNVLKWLESIAFNTEQLVSRLNCKVNLIALEDVINVNEEQLITLAYENEKKMYVFTKTKRKVATLTDFVSNEVDNLTTP